MPSRHLIACLALAACTNAASADCFDSAAAYHRVNPWVLRAIAHGEAKYNPHAVARNQDRSVDVGMMQINSIHFPELQRHGIAPSALYDPCTSIFVAAWHLRKKVDKHGNTWKAVGAYHSETPQHRDSYAERIKRTIDGWIKAGHIR